MRRNATIIRPAETDRFGDQVAPPVEILEKHTWTLSIGSNWDTSDGTRNEESRRLTAYVVGNSTQVVATDLVRVDGNTYQVDGHPVRAESPFNGRLAGYTVTLKAYLG